MPQRADEVKNTEGMCFSAFVSEFISAFALLLLRFPFLSFL
jgi:hypothetical protein